MPHARTDLRATALALSALFLAGVGGCARRGPGPTNVPAGQPPAGPAQPAAGGPVAPAPPPPVPAEWAAPPGPPVLRAQATGVQIYKAAAAADGKLTWTLVGPEADLRDNQGAFINRGAIIIRRGLCSGE